jgi:hypothetical protein
MNHDSFDHVIRAAGGVLGEDAIIVIGSQAILASVDRPPPAAQRSIEVDVLPFDGDQRKADLVDGSIGEASMFQESFGVYAQGVGLSTAVLPDGWRDRLVTYRTPATGGVTALCLDPVDLVVAKLVANRPKDREFCVELVLRSIVGVDAVVDRLTLLAVDERERRTLVERAQGLVPPIDR